MDLYVTLGMLSSALYLAAYFINITFWRFSSHKLLNGIIGETEDDEDLFFGTMLTVLVAIIIGLVVPIIIFSAVVSLLVWFIRAVKNERVEEPEERNLTIIK